MKRDKSISAAARRTARLRVIQVCVFLLVFYVVSVLSLVMPLRPTYSEMENRYLTPFPEFTIEALLDGSYFDGINKWFADTFPMRDSFMGVANFVENLYGGSSGQMEIHGEVQTGDAIPDVTRTTADMPTATTSPAITTGTRPSTADSLTTTTTTPTTPSQGSNKPAGQDQVPAQSFGAILTIGDSGFEYYNFVNSVADKYIGAVNRAGDQLAGVANVYDVVIPTSMDICVDSSLLATLNTSDQKKAIDYFYANMNSNVKVVDVFDVLKTAHNNGEYLYFRTDHHWTTLGAYRVYEQLCNVKGTAATPLSVFELREYYDYLGSFYRETKLPAMEANPDVVQAFVPPSTNTMTITNSDGSTFEYPIIVDVSTWSQLYKYNAFIGGDNPISVIENPNKTDGSSCVLIKESFGNAFAPFLVEDYQTVYILDYRYFAQVNGSSLKEFVVANDIEDVILLNNISATRSPSLVDAIDKLVR